MSAMQWAEKGIPLWVQEPDSCEAPSMPEAIIDSKLASLVADPIELANRLNDYFISRKSGNGESS